MDSRKKKKFISVEGPNPNYIKLKKIALFIPCYNEENRLKVSSFLSFMVLHESLIDFYFVDDGSQDETSEVLKKEFGSFKHVFLLKLKRNIGKGNALREGIIQIRNKGYDFFGFIDADLDIPLNQILALYEGINDSDQVVAISRRNLKSNIKSFRLRSIASVFMVFIANGIIKVKPRINDTQCGCKIFRSEVLDICFGEKFISEWLFDIEIFMRLKAKYPRNQILEVPLLVEIKSENSKFLFHKNYRIIRQLLKIRTRYN